MSCSAFPAVCGQQPGVSIFESSWLCVHGCEWLRSGLLSFLLLGIDSKVVLPVDIRSKH